MSTPKECLADLLADVSCIKIVLGDIEKVATNVSDVEVEPNLSQVFNNARDSVKSLVQTVCKTSKDFNTKYDLLLEKKVIVRSAEERSDELENEIDAPTEKSSKSADVSCDSVITSENSAEEISTGNVNAEHVQEPDENLSGISSNDLGINNAECNNRSGDVAESKNNTDDEISNDKASNGDKSNISDSDNVGDGGTVETSTDLKSDNTDTVNHSSKGEDRESDVDEKIKTESRPMITLVDINKLVDPNRKQNKKFTCGSSDESSVILLSPSSDDGDNKQLVSTKHKTKKNRAERSSRRLRNNSEANKSKNRRIKLEGDSNNDSDSDLKSNRPSRSSRIAKKAKPGTRSTPISLRLRKASLIVISDDSDESDAAEEKNKSKKALDNKVDIGKTNLRNPKPSSKPARNIRENASKVVSDSTGREINKTDDKFNSKAVVLLPLIPCEKLQEACLENEKLFDVKRLSDTVTLKRKRNADENLGESSSSTNSDKRIIKRRMGPKSKTQQQDGAVLEKKTKEPSKDSKSKGKPGPKSKTVLRETRSNKKCASSEEDPLAEDPEKVDVPSSKTIDEKQESSNEEVNDAVMSDEEDEKQSSETDKESEVASDAPGDQHNQTISISSSDSEEELKANAARKVKRKNKHRIDSDSDFDAKEGSDKEKDSDKKPDSNSSSDEDKNIDRSSSSGSEEDRKAFARKKRKRIQKVEESSDEDDKSTRKQIRKVRAVSKSTVVAETEEKERKARILEKQKKYNHIFNTPTEVNAKVEKVVLDLDEKTEKPILKVDDKIVAHLKPHQASGIQFMWDACFESMKRLKKTIGSGCILAHCMGLGKTLQVVALSHTLLVNEETRVNKVMVVAPLNTVLNWVAEYKKWMPDEDDFEIYELVTCKPNERQYEIENWNKTGGVLIIGYQMFRTLTDPNSKRIHRKLKELYRTSLVDPGPDLVICDEGHLLKNEKSHLSIAMNRIKTLRRIVLTGTPLQNNLREYFCMVQFIKPNLLGSYKEYLNRFVNPITNGQYTDSTPFDIALMRRRSHVLHKLLDGVVQRRDYAVLAPYLPPKYEYILDVSLTELQIKLYEHYMTHFARQNQSGKTSYLFVDFEVLRSICTHPRVLLHKHIANDKKECMKSDDEEDSEGSLKDFLDDSEDELLLEKKKDNNIVDDDDDSCESVNNDSQPRRQRVTRAQAAAAKANGVELIEEEVTKVIAHNAWWRQYCSDEDLDNIANSNKMYLMFEILKECEQIGDKVLIFSQSLFSLNLIEYFLSKIDEASQENNTEKTAGFSGSWALGLDYFRLDGSSSCDNRTSWCNTFNDPNNTRARLFLISTRAGGLGINLVAANRVIIFDVSWNPSHDIQSIYRVYRFGQTKPCYIYRFVTYGTMEMKIYERQVTKQAISKRVIDEQQIDRHYNQNDLAELYKFEPKMANRPIPLVPKDVLLGELLHTHEDKLVTYHEHQSLLENKQDEELNEEERKAAWDEFENEKVARTLNSFNSMGVQMSPHMVTLALNNLIKKDNPNWTSEQIKSILPAMVKELELQVSKGDLTMYKRIEQEIRIIHLANFKRNNELMLAQKNFQILQQRQQQLYNNSVQGMNLQNIENIRQFNLWKAGGMGNMPGPSGLPRGLPSGLSVRTKPSNPNEIIDLND